MFDEMLQQVRSYFREMNVAEQLADAMLRIEPENMRILNGAALVNFGLTPEDPAWREMKELKAAQGLGLDRAEYMRRKALAIRSCSDPATFCAEAIMKTGKVDSTISPTEPDFSQYGRPLKSSR